MRLAALVLAAVATCAQVLSAAAGEILSGSVPSSAQAGTCSWGNAATPNASYVNEDGAYQQLRQWAHQVSGHEPLAEVGEVCYGTGDDAFCMRGLRAVIDIKENDLIATLPSQYVVTLPRPDAEAWLEKIHEVPDFNTTFALWLAVLPPKGYYMTAEGLSDEELPLLHNDTLGQRFTQRQAYLKGLHTAATTNASSMVARHNVSYDAYALAYLTVATRYWAFWEDVPAASGNGTVQVSIPTMIPFLDMANHNNSPNAYVSKEEGVAVMRATHNISRGAEVLIVYQANQLHRADVAMLNYGYVPKQSPPLLFVHDLGGEVGNAMRSSGEVLASPLNDDDYKLGGAACSNENLARMLKTLASFPTTEAQDRQLLQQGNWTDRQRVLLEMRADRKAALAFNAARITDGIKEWRILTNRTRRRWEYGSFNASSMNDKDGEVSDNLSDTLRMDWKYADMLVEEFEKLQQQTATAAA